jgi:hypothetical protein
MLISLSHIDIAKGVHGNSPRIRILTVSWNKRTPLGYEIPGRVKLLVDAILRSISHIDIARGIHGDSTRPEKLTVSTTPRTPLGYEIPG